MEQSNEGVHHEKSIDLACIVSWHYRYVFEWLRVSRVEMWGRDRCICGSPSGSRAHARASPGSSSTEEGPLLIQTTGALPR